MRRPQIDLKRLAQFEVAVLDKGSHSVIDTKRCAMEWVAYLAGEPHSDHPACVSPVITAYIISLNDSRDSVDRQVLKPYLPRILGTFATPEIETRRYVLTLDWMMREHRSIWLEAAARHEHAAEMRALPEVTNKMTFRTAAEAQYAAIEDALNAWNAWNIWNARAAWDIWNARAVWDVGDVRAVQDVRDTWGVRDVRDAWNVWNVRDAISGLVVDRAGDGAAAGQREAAGIEALEAVTRQVRASELELLDRLLACGSEVQS